MMEEMHAESVSILRQNVFLSVREKDKLSNPYSDLGDFISATFLLNNSKKVGNQGIIICQDRSDVDLVAKQLSARNIPTLAFHSTIGKKKKINILEKWASGEVPVVATTSGYAPKLEKTSIRFVAHWTMASSISTYFRESRMAGGDNKDAQCLLYFSCDDHRIISHFLENDVLENLAKASDVWETFREMTNYCMNGKCRYGSFAKFFGKAFFQCEKYCDVCQKKERSNRSTEKKSILAERKNGVWKNRRVFNHDRLMTRTNINLRKLDQTLLPEDLEKEAQSLELEVFENSSHMEQYNSKLKKIEECTAKKLVFPGLKINAKPQNKRHSSLTTRHLKKKKRKICEIVDLVSISESEEDSIVGERKKDEKSNQERKASNSEMKRVEVENVAANKSKIESETLPNAKEKEIFNRKIIAINKHIFEYFNRIRDEVKNVSMTEDELRHIKLKIRSFLITKAKTADEKTIKKLLELSVKKYIFKENDGKGKKN